MPDNENSLVDEGTQIGLKKAVKLAATYFNELYEDEQLRNVLLEEVEYDNSREVWLITFGYDTSRTETGGIIGSRIIRDYKTVQVDASTGGPYCTKDAQSMIDLFHQQVKRYRQSGVLLDTNLFMLLLVGTLDPTKIGSFKRTNRYVSEDFEILRILLEPFDSLVTTPHILAEVSNLSGNQGDHFGNAYFQLFVERIKLAIEVYYPSRELMLKPEFLKYGLADTGIAQAAAGRYLVLTDDLPLYVYLASSGTDAVNFTHFRQQYLLG